MVNRAVDLGIVGAFPVLRPASKSVRWRARQGWKKGARLCSTQGNYWRMRKKAGLFVPQMGSGRGKIVVLVPLAKVLVWDGKATQFVVFGSQLHSGVKLQVFVPVVLMTMLLLTEI